MSKSQIPAHAQFQKIAFILVLYTILVILWGAWVRISHSGDGCGDTWPLCQGQVLPHAAQGKTWVELSHRLTSGLFGIFVVGLFFWARKVFQAGHPVRRWTALSLLFTITEALLGAKLVIFGLVGSNDSGFRLFTMSLHLLNSLLLVASLTLTWDYSRSLHPWIRRLKSPLTTAAIKFSRLSFIFIGVFVVIALTGAWAALSTTLFPSESLWQGLQTDFQKDSHFLLKLRGFHPLFGLLLGGGLTLSFWLLSQALSNTEKELIQRTKRLAAALLVAVLFGLATLLSLSPVWMKIGHLTLTHGVWILLILWIREWNWQEKRLS